MRILMISSLWRRALSSFGVAWLKATSAHACWSARMAKPATNSGPGRKRANSAFRSRKNPPRLAVMNCKSSGCPNGEIPREACLQISVPFLASLWKAIRDFEPDYLFCPPLGTDPLAGVHNDHLTVAEAVRRVAYMINVPHAFTPEYPTDETKSTQRKVPVIINVYDGYMFGASSFDLAIDVEDAFPKIAETSWCHQSQIAEWLPWVGRHNMRPPRTMEEWTKTLRDRFDRKNREVGIQSPRAFEFSRSQPGGKFPISKNYSAISLPFPRSFPTWTRSAKARTLACLGSVFISLRLVHLLRVVRNVRQSNYLSRSTAGILASVNHRHSVHHYPRKPAGIVMGALDEVSSCTLAGSKMRISAALPSFNSPRPFSRKVEAGREVMRRIASSRCRTFISRHSVEQPGVVAIPAGMRHSLCQKPAPRCRKRSSCSDGMEDFQIVFTHAVKNRRSPLHGFGCPE